MEPRLRPPCGPRCSKRLQEEERAIKTLKHYLKLHQRATLLVCVVLVSTFASVARGAVSAADKGRYLVFDDYNQTNGVTPTWQHIGTTTQGGSEPGTDHFHKSGWSFTQTRMGRVTPGTSIAPDLNGNVYVPDINYCAYFRNSTDARMESPIFTNGVTTLEFDMVPVTLLATLPIIKVFIATNIVDVMAPIPNQCVGGN
jgi:hypothetical protein